MGLLLKCEHVGFGYENQDAVLDVNLEVNEGDYICIVGENGSGKSTLMKGILGLLKPTSGRIEYSEELKKAGIGYLPQQTDAQKDFPATVFEVVISGCLGKRGSRPFYSMKEKKEEYQEEENRQQEQAKKIRGNGFDAQVFVTTDWSNLNTEKWYVITAGTYGTEEAASAVLPDVQRVCSDAYIKYSGNWQG